MNALTSLAKVVLAGAAAHDERGVTAGAHHGAGRLAVDGQQCERALEPLADAAHRGGEPLGRVGDIPVERRELGGDQVGGALGVGLAGELDAARLQLGPQPAKFSRIPLWITATRPSAERCGCALRSFGAPWVAHRVCPIPVMPCVRVAPTPVSASAFSRLASLPARFSASSAPPPSRMADAGRVVPAVLEPAQPVDHDVQRRTAAGVPHNPTHEQHRSMSNKHPA
jgi:hypothetical protein